MVFGWRDCFILVSWSSVWGSTEGVVTCPCQASSTDILRRFLCSDYRLQVVTTTLSNNSTYQYVEPKSCSLVRATTFDPTPVFFFFLFHVFHRAVPPIFPPTSLPFSNPSWHMIFLYCQLKFHLVRQLLHSKILVLKDKSSQMWLGRQVSDYKQYEQDEISVCRCDRS